MDQYNNYNRRRYPQKRKRRNYRRIRNRIVIVSTGVLLIFLFILLLTSIASCGDDSNEAETNTAETEVTQEVAADANDPLSINVYTKPDIEDNGTTGVDSGGVYVWNRTAFEKFYGGDSQAQRYAQLMNEAAKSLGDNIKVYSLIAPNHTEFGLPDRLKIDDNGMTLSESQADYLKAAYQAMDESVTAINPYNKLSEHCNEYIYFDSDHHWTGLGAYYAYEAFAQTLDMPVLDLSSCTENQIEGFTGTLMKLTYEPVNTDTVHYWTFPYTVSNTIHNQYGSANTYDSCYYPYSEAGDNTYGVFLMGDNPLEVIESTSPSSNGEKIAIVHESYGNAITPYLTYNYDVVYSIDFRSWNGNLNDFCAENGITNVLFMSGVMSTANQSHLDSISAILTK